MKATLPENDYNSVSLIAGLRNTAARLLPWYFLIILFFISAVLTHEKSVANIYRVFMCTLIMLLISREDIKQLFCDRFFLLFSILLLYSGITSFWNDMGVADKIWLRVGVTFIFTYWCFLIKKHNPDRVKTIPLLYIAAGLIILAEILLTKDIRTLTSRSNFVYGIFGHPSALGSYMAVTCVICYYSFVHRSKGILFACLTVLFAFATLLSQSRGALLGLITGLASVILFMSPDKKLTRRLLEFLTLFTLCCIIFSLLDSFFMDLIHRKDAGRFIIYQSVWDRINDSWFHFFLGHGAGSDQSTWLGGFKAHNAHSMYLGTWFNTGITGLILLLSCLLPRMFKIIIGQCQCNIWDAMLFCSGTLLLTDLDKFYAYPGSMFFIFLLPLILANLNKPSSGMTPSGAGS